MKKLPMFLLMSFYYAGACDERVRVKTLAKRYSSCLISINRQNSSEENISCSDVISPFGHTSIWIHDKSTNRYRYKHEDHDYGAGHLLFGYSIPVMTYRESSQAEFDLMKKVAHFVEQKKVN